MGNKNDECCSSECCCEEEKKQTMTGMAVEMGDKAWMAVIQRKMEANLEKTMGKQLGKVAGIMAEYVHKYYAASMQGKKLSAGETAAFEKKLNDAMM
ncbi:MAG: hypothetical protein NTV88_04290 [Candidatus Micrarchaeota archaeon]|nr:hypothetical protein [Candidatus Micrarchaeota archaeon]